MELTRKDIRKMAQGMAHNEVRYLVDTYYEIQEYRKSTDNRERAADEGLDDQPKFISMMLMDFLSLKNTQSGPWTNM